MFQTHTFPENFGSIEWILSRDSTFRYMMLARLRCDCDYFLGYGNRRTKHLYCGDVDKQIEYMKAIWSAFPADGKPVWLTMEQIEDYGRRMRG